MIERIMTRERLLGAGNRIRAAIAMAGLRINEFCQKSGFPSGTIWSWQNDRSPLTEKGARRLSETLLEFGVKCSAEWLLDGAGDPPLPLISTYKKYDSISAIQETDLSFEASLLKEIEFFLSLNRTHKVVGMRDDSMLPFYEQGDYLGGIKLEEVEFGKSINKNCIVKTADGNTLIRKVLKGTNKNRYTITCTNLTTKAKFPVINDASIVDIFVIIWHRKRF